MRSLALGVCFALVVAGCSFIDDFDYEFADGGVADADAAPPDGRVDGGPLPCTDPCLGDALEDFSPDVQRAGDLEWQYLADDRALPGLSYVQLAPDTIFDAEAWSAGAPRPAIVRCGDSTTGPCAEASGGLLFETEAAGEGDDPVLAFTAPADGTFTVMTEARGIFGDAEIRLSRNGRLDAVAIGYVNGGSMEVFTSTFELFAGERGIITVSPVGVGTASVGARVRVLRDLGSAPLADCQMALRFQNSMDPLLVECTSASITEFSGTMTQVVAAPDSSVGGARSFQWGSALQVNGARFDYSGDFTVQMWVRVDALMDRGTAIYADWSGAVPESAGGLSFGLDPLDATTMIENALIAAYLFPLPDPPIDDPSVTCGTSCYGEIVTPVPELGAWHFYRFVRDSAEDEVRLCIDGELVGSGALPGDVDMSNPMDPMLGTFGVDATFDGAIDDVRVFRRALPCGS